MQVFSDLIRALQKAQAELVLDIEEKQRKTESWANEQIEELKREIHVLKTRNTEMEYLARTEDHIHFLQVLNALYILTFRGCPFLVWSRSQITS